MSTHKLLFLGLLQNILHYRGRLVTGMHETSQLRTIFKFARSFTANFRQLRLSPEALITSLKDYYMCRYVILNYINTCAVYDYEVSLYIMIIFFQALLSIEKMCT